MNSTTLKIEGRRGVRWEGGGREEGSKVQRRREGGGRDEKRV